MGEGDAAEMGCRGDFDDVYETGTELGAGAFGQVRVGRAIESGQGVAIKSMVKVRGKLTREKTLAKIARELGFMQRMQGQPCVVRMLNCFEDADAVHMVTELCTGGDLRKYVETNGTLDEDTLAVIALQTVRFVRACHKNGIVYGDVKPANLVLPTPGPPAGKPFLVKAIDFGTSQPLDNPHKRLRRRAGTFSFMAPEVFERNYSVAADMWSLGVMLYWLYSNRFPFWDNGNVPATASVESIAEAIRSYPINFDADVFDGLGEDAADFLSRCLQRREDDRLTTRAALEHPWLQRAVGALNELGSELGGSEETLSECIAGDDPNCTACLAYWDTVADEDLEVPEEEAN